MKTDIPDDMAFKVLASGAAIAAGLAVRQGLEKGWERVSGRKPPRNPGSPLTDWREAMIWAAATGIAVGVGRVLGRRLLTTGWRRFRGRLPVGGVLER